MNIYMYIFIYTYICLSVPSNFAATRSRHFPSVPPTSLSLSVPLSLPIPFSFFPLLFPYHPKLRVLCHPSAAP